MKIRINENNRMAIQEALLAVNGTATIHTARASAVFALVLTAEAELAGVAKKRRAGASARFTSGGKVANSYSYDRVVTAFRIERGTVGWFLTYAEKRTILPNSYVGSSVFLTYDQTLDVLNTFVRRNVFLTTTPPETKAVAVVDGGAL